MEKYKHELANELLTPDFWSIQLMYCLNYLYINDLTYTLQRLYASPIDEVTGELDEHMETTIMMDNVDIMETERRITQHMSTLRYMDRAANAVNESDDKTVDDFDANGFQDLYLQLTKRMIFDSSVDYAGTYDEEKYGNVHNFTEFYERYLKLGMGYSRKHIEGISERMHAPDEDDSEKKDHKVIQFGKKKE